MKNIFKLMSLALVAGSLMFVSCGDKNNNNNDDPTPETPTTSTSVTFNGQTWEVGASAVSTNYVSQYNLLYTRLYKVNQQLPYVDMFFAPQVGTETSEANIATRYEGTDSAYTYVSGYSNDALYLLEYGEQTQIQTGENSYSGDWAMLNGTVNVTAIDLNALTASYTVNATMYDFYSWAYGLANNVEDAETRELTVAISNYTFNN